MPWAETLLWFTTNFIVAGICYYLGWKRALKVIHASFLRYLSRRKDKGSIAVEGHAYAMVHVTEIPDGHDIDDLKIITLNGDDADLMKTPPQGSA